MSADTQFQPFETVEGNPSSPILLIADHASNACPPEYDSLGLPPSEFERHIAYDIGVAGVTRALAKALSAPAVLGGFSRLLIDPNRGQRDPTLVMKISDGSIIPGNRHVDSAETERRLERFYRPYDSALGEHIEQMKAAPGNAPALISIHSFTPQLQGRPARPWQIGLLRDTDMDNVDRALATLRAEPDLTVGDNEPYKGALPGDTIDRHATAGGLRHLLIEVRNDLIETETGQLEWANRLIPMLKTVFG